MFDQDALENFLNQEREQNKGSKYFLRKLKTTNKIALPRKSKTSDTSMILCMYMHM